MLPSRSGRPGAIDGEPPAELQHTPAHRLDHVVIADVVQHVAHPVRELHGLGNAEAARGDRRRADAQAAGHRRRTRVVRHGVLVHRDVGLAQRRVGIGAGVGLADQVDQHQVVVGAARDDVDAALDEGARHRARVVHDLLLVDLEAGLQRLLEAHGLGRDHVHQRAALAAGEHGGVQLLGDLVVLCAR